ncbi:protein EMBRYO DEFECTIVE 514 [Abrus precatorius]|uniref:Protein EMBRYO DEFECTIVE 514 n=1 Tax=Abrus precatorius TaxID=3816 RepID=A0A8B8MJQ9_ABRPR|nr:protein EMBRYO DEFECTIVE 514 [Abrus precatorius]
MVVENGETAQVPGGEWNEKRTREDEGEEEACVSKKQKVEEKKPSGPVNLGFKSFASSVEMFDYFYNLLHVWPPYLNLNKYEHVMLLELLKNGHMEADIKVGGGIHAFQVRKHPVWKSSCFFLIREDESVDDFSFRKCVDHILPLPEEMQVKHDVNRALGVVKHHRGGKGGGGGGRKGRSRH